MKLNTIIKFKKELENIKKEELTISGYCKKYNKDTKYFYNKFTNLNKTDNIDYIDIINETKDLYNSLKCKNNSNSNNDEVLEEDIKEDEKSTVIYLRNSKNNIISYRVIVKVRDKADFDVVLSRSEVETIFGLYTYYGGNITARNVANEFPRFTLSEIKKIFRAFKLTKDSAWFPPHLNEELTEEELTQYRMNLKERSAFKYADSRQERDFKNTINKMASEINQLKDFRNYLNEIVENNTKIYNPTYFPKIKTENQTLIIYLSDVHVGARVDSNSLFENHYDLNVMFKRVDQIIKYVKAFNPERIVIAQLGDLLDGMDSFTNSRTHTIPQNMNNFEQIDNAVKLVHYLFDNLIANKCANKYSYISVPCGNHTGAAEYATNQIISSTLKLKYPEIETQLTDKFFLRYDVDDYTLLLSHGKAAEYMQKGFPINLNDNLENKINQYLDTELNVKKNILVISGDLHNESMNRGKRFKYYKVGSFFGSSEYCMYGWGNTTPHVNYHLISNNIVLNGTIELN